MKRGTTLIEAVAHCEDIYAKLMQGYTYPSKAAKKEDRSYLARTYDMVTGDSEFFTFAHDYARAERERLMDEACIDRSTIETMYSAMSEIEKINKKISKTHDYPLDLHNVRMCHIENIFSLFSNDVANMVERLAFILGAVKQTEVAERKENTLSPEQRALNAIGIDKSRFADRNLIKEAYAVYKDMDNEKLKDFRTQHIVDVDLINVTNEYGTNFLRHMFFLNGKREAFAVVMSFVDKDFDFWLVSGAPDLKGKSFEQIKAFYSEAA